MSGLFSSGATQKAAPEASSLRITTSSFGRPIPIVIGCARVATWVMWYGDFKAIEHSEQVGGKGGGGATSTTYTYEAAMMLGLVEGPIDRIRIIWRAQDELFPNEAGEPDLAEINGTLFKGDNSQTVWPWLQTNHPSDALAYRGLAYIGIPSLDLGNNTSIPNVGVEVVTSHSFSTAIRDAAPATLLREYLTNQAWGVGLPAGMVGDLTSYDDYTVASGLFMSADYVEQEQAAGVVTRILAATNSDVVAEGGTLKIVPYADQAVTGYGRDWTPDLTAAYELNQEHFAPGSFKARRRDPLKRYNTVKLKFRDRGIQYNESVAEAKDDTNVNLYGPRIAPDVTVPEIKLGTVANAAANLIQQRHMNVVAEYSFRLPFNFALASPMDCLVISYPPLRIVNKLVRIQKITESGFWLDFEVEEVPIGTATSITFPYQQPLGYQVNASVAPGSVDAPVIFEGPARAGSAGVEVYIAARGAGEFWGGCQVWTSLDGVTYKQIASISGPSRFGTLTASATSSATSMQVSGLGSSQLLPGSAADAAQFTSLCYLGAADGSAPEFVAYEGATLTGSGAYTLSGLVRGGYGLPAVAHAAGSKFVRVDDRVASSGPLDLSMVGQTLYVKCLSFNLWGGGQQSLADVPAYTYTVTGLTRGVPPDVTGLQARVIPGLLVFQWAPCPVLDYAETEIRLGAEWDTGVSAYVGKASLYQWAWPEIGSYSLLFRHRDTSGLLSAGITRLNVTVTASAILIGMEVGWVDGGTPVSWADDGTPITWTAGDGISYLIDTAQAAPNMATDVYSTFVAGPVTFSTIT